MCCEILLSSWHFVYHLAGGPFFTDDFVCLSLVVVAKNGSLTFFEASITYNSPW